MCWPPGMLTTSLFTARRRSGPAWPDVRPLDAGVLGWHRSGRDRVLLLLTGVPISVRLLLLPAHGRVPGVACHQDQPKLQSAGPTSLLSYPWGKGSCKPLTYN